MSKHSSKNGILLVAFGISTEIAQEALQLFERSVQANYPKTNIRWAFTSKIARDRMEKRQIKADSVKKALIDMANENYDFIAIQSLHLIEGAEYDSLVQEVKKVKHDLSVQIAMGRPLLSTKEDIDFASKTLFSLIPKERKSDEAVLFMGHGTKHGGEKAYKLLADCMYEKDSFAHIGTLEGETTITTLLPIFHNKGVKHVWLLPLFSIIGKHTLKDMIGTTHDSWQSILCKEGFVCTPIVKGIAEYPEFRSLWISHLAKAVEALSVPFT